ncbi:hypothetical protein [Blastochloris sulfoviridis]|uniref:Uncharacterized protein n=1 Tax=Blastochloris sulfoviridis TaxID=50712 RepID=A0A5M6I0Q9_9HYPH|nr:hypothetical protein [Blastochloris sulfoviridis]KAA5601756.1 hypothetical protein F1193_08530 [Blastochloris sulfoviridis]
MSAARHLQHHVTEPQRRAGGDWRRSPHQRHHWLLQFHRATVKVEARSLSSSLAETSIVLILGILLGIGTCCWLFFTLAVYALPLYAAISLGMWVYHDGGGAAAPVGIGILAGVAVWLGGQLMLAFARSAWIRGLVALAFAVPAGMAGYSVAHGLSTLAIADPRWQAAVAIIGAVAVAGSALARLALAPMTPETPSAGGPSHQSLGPPPSDQMVTAPTRRL